MASIFKRGGIYYVRVRQGARDIKRRIGPDKKAAEAVAAKLDQDMALASAANQVWTGLEPARSRQGKKTFAEAAAEFLEERANAKASTLDSYRSILRAHLLPKFGKLPLAEISESMVAKWQAKLAQESSPARVNAIIQVLRSILATAYRRGEIVRDATSGVKRLQRRKTKVDPLSERELELVLARIEWHYRPLFVCLAYTGARPNELIALRWSDIDWHNREISITKGRVRGKEGDPKTQSSTRNIPMLVPVEQALREQQSWQVQEIANYVFTTKRGRPICKHLDRIWASALRKAGLRHRPSYQLRHTFASLCLLKGMAPGYVSKLLGHSTLETFYRHYARWIEEATSLQEQKLRDAFGGNQVKESAGIYLVKKQSTERQVG